MKKIFIFLICLSTISACSIDSPDNQNTQMANPASVKCVEDGGKLSIRIDTDGGQYGVCIFDDGNECEEWAYFRGECQEPQDKPICTTEDKPVCALVEIQCITTPCDPVLETFENHCLAEEQMSVISFVDGKCEVQLDSTCKKDNDCLLPADYAMRSSCPFATKCLNQQCIVVCPDF